MNEFSQFADIGDIDFSLEEIQSTKKKTLIPEKHLDSPITVSLLHRLQDIMDMVFADQHNLKQTQYDPRRAGCVHKFLGAHPELCFSGIRGPLMQYQEALEFCKKRPEILTAHHYPHLFSLSSATANRLKTDMKLARGIYESEMNAYISTFTDILPPATIASMKRCYLVDTTPDEDVVRSSNQSQLWSDIVDNYRKTYKKHQKMKKLNFGPVRVVHGDGFSLIKTDDYDHWLLCTFEQLQMIQDCCLARHNVFLALQMRFHNGSINLKDHVKRILKWQESVILTIGNEGYELVKAPEAVFKAHLNSLTMGDLLPYSSYDRTLDKMRKKEFALHGSDSLISALHREVCLVTDLHDAAELFGLSKLSGHPSVYAHRSAESVRKEAQPVGTIQPYAVKQMVRMFKHLTLQGYINKHMSWPNLQCLPARDTELRRHYNNRVTSLPLGSYPINEIDAIKFGKFVEYDYSEDYLKFLDDKAICPGASEMSKFWYRGDRDEPRRLLQKVLQMEKFDTVELVERLRRGRFKPDEYVVELTQKERELKIAARCFCKLVFPVRTFFTSTEYNLKEQFLSKYFPQQTMTMSSTETKERMYNLVRHARDRSRTLLEVDFSRWNLRWREITVNPIASELEDIFGLPGVFSQAHPFFTKATIVLTDKHTLPPGARPDIPITRWPQSDLVWRGTHLGGFEGIQQALWTTCTIAMMYWVMHDQNLSFNMAGQGDNQIFAITFDESNETLPNKLRRLLATMEIRCALLNHEVKPDECIDSQTVLTYSKDIYVNGNHVLYNLKFASRSFRREEIDIPSLSTEIAGVSAVAMACADSVYNTPRAIYWKTYQTIRLLSSRYLSPLHSVEKTSLKRILLDQQLLSFVLRLPGSLGGLPIMQWTRFFLKGEVDDVSWDVPSILRDSEARILHWDLHELMSGRYTPKSPDLTQLILDPTSLPIARPKDLKRLVKEAVARDIAGHTKNKWIREIFTDASETAENNLKQILIEARPFYPKIMSDIYSLSPSGVRDALLSRFTMTRTITAMVSDESFISQIELANSALLQSIIRRYDHAKLKKGKPELPVMAYDICKKLRSLWGSNVEHKNIGVYNPFDFRVQYVTTDKPMISASSRCPDGEKLRDSQGPYPPNFGTKTKQKVSDHGFKIITSSSTVRDLKALVLTVSELGSHPSLIQILNNISLARSPWTIEQLMTILPTAYGGTAAHRHEDINKNAFSILGSRTIPSHLNFCSDLAGKLSGGEFDFPVAFQEFYLTLTNTYQVLEHFTANIRNASIGFALTDEYEPLPTDSVVIEKYRDIRWSVKPDNALCYISKFQVVEVPEVPQETQVKHISPERVPVRHLIYNRLLSKYASKRRIFVSSSIVNLPIDMLDMKEFNHCPLNELIKGCIYFITVMSIYIVTKEYQKDAAIFLYHTITRFTHACSGLLARMMLHPDFSMSTYAVENGVLAEPGTSGARAAADNLSGELLEMCILSIRAREFLTDSVPLLLFADFSSLGRATGEIHCYAKLALQSPDPDRILLSSYQRLMLATSSYSLIHHVSPLNAILGLLSATETLGRKEINQEGFEVPKYSLAIRYINQTADEAIRTIRSLPRDFRVKHTLSLNKVSCRRGLNRARVQFKQNEVDGSLLPVHKCPDTTSEERQLDSVLSLFLRPAYIYSSAICIWSPILMSKQSLIRGASCLSIGVGHGAVAASLLNLGAEHVYGVDLRDAMPAIVQRELTYLPPEVIRSGRGESFSWSNFVSTTGGDILKNISFLRDLEPAHICVIDIEQNTQETLSLLTNLPKFKLLIIRLICCTDWMTYITSALQPQAVYHTSIVNSHKSSYIFIRENFSLFNPNANYDQYTAVSVPRWRSVCDKDPRHTLAFFNHVLKPVGVQLKIVSPSEITNVVSKLRRSYLNSDTNDPMRLQLEYVYTSLSLIQNVYMSIPNFTKESLLMLDAFQKRLLCVWVANSGFDIDSIVESVLPDLNSE